VWIIEAHTLYAELYSNKIHHEPIYALQFYLEKGVPSPLKILSESLNEGLTISLDETRVC